MIYLISNQTKLPEEDIMQQTDLSMMFEYFKSEESIALDTETTGFDPFTNKLLTIQIGDYVNQWVIDLNYVNINELKEFIESKLVLVHNFLFDGKWLLHNNIKPKNIYDSFLAELILTTGYERSKGILGLKDVAKKYLDVEISKDDRGLIHRQGLTSRVIRYCAKDVQYLHLIREKQLEEIRKYDLEKVLDLENKVICVFVGMNYNGLQIDAKAWKEVASLTEKTVEEVSEKLDEFIVEESKQNKKLQRYINNQTNLFDYPEKKTRINWASNAQKKTILNELGIKVDDVSDKTLQKLKKHDIVKELIVLSKNLKLSTSFGNEFLTFINPVSGRIHPEIFPILKTGRISMQVPNLQQVPSHGNLAEKIRKCFICEKERLLVDTDVKAFEINLLAEYSQDPVWLDILNNDRDIHSELCARTFNIPIEDVNKPFPPKPDFTYRFVQKVISFGLSYGMTEHKLAETVQINKDAAKEIIKKFFSIIPKVESFLNMIAKTAVTNGYIRTDPHYRRIRWFPNLDKSNPTTIGSTEREAKNTPMQGSNANLIKQCLINLQDEIDKNNYDVKLILSVHDEILADVEESFAETWKDIQERIMIETISIIIKSIPVKVNSEIAPYWKH